MPVGGTPKISHIIDGSVRTDFTETYAAYSTYQRDFVPQAPVAPYDDFYVELKIKLCPGATPPNSLPFNQTLEAWDFLTGTGSQRVPVVDRGGFDLHASNATEAIYRWTLLGWDTGPGTGGFLPGITTRIDPRSKSQNMEILAESLRQAPTNGVALHLIDAVPAERWDNISMTNCMHLWGGHSVPHPFVTMRGKSAASVNAGIVTREGLDIWKNGITAIDPFRPNSRLFSIYSDLAAHLDTTWPLESNGGDKYFKDPNKPLSVLSCPFKPREFLFYNAITYQGGWAEGGTPAVFLGLGSTVTTAMHETGHAFCNLEDEYTVGTYPPLFHSWANTNCQPNWAAYQYNNLWYGDWGASARWGCWYYYRYWAGPGEPIQSWRPSDVSIMNDIAKFSAHQDINRFNQVSCAWCMKAIFGGSSDRAYRPQCAPMNTVRVSPHP